MSISESVFSSWFVTNSVWVAGATASALGAFPTVTDGCAASQPEVAPARQVAVSITVTVFATDAATYRVWVALSSTAADADGTEAVGGT